MISNDFVKNLKSYVDFLPVCPEVGIGLGSPRPPIRLVKIGGEKNLYQPSNGENLTQKMNDFATKFLDGIQDLDGFILKQSSPTCGVRNVKVYHKIGKAVGYDKGMGIFTEAIIKKFPNAIIEDEDRLRNPILKDSFLTRLYTMARLRESMSSKDSLSEFCKNNEMLFLCYDHTSSKKITDLISDYSFTNNFQNKFTQLVFDILNRIPSSNSLYATYTYIFSLLEDRLTVPEKEYFEANLRDFTQGIVMPSQVSTLLYSWALRFEKKSIVHQSIFEPYPKKISITNAKKREYSLLDCKNL